MSITIKYKNEFGSEITQQQIDYGLEYFSKIIYENDIPKMQEIYKNGELVNTSKYVSTTQEITDELIINPDATFDYMYNQNGYKVHEIQTYESSVIQDKVIKVYDANDNMICFRDYKIDNGNTISHVTEKNFYDANGEEKYSFDYNSDGTCFIIHDEQEDQADIYAWSIGQSDVSFTWSGLEYYENADPIVPN